jgi:hypothetical protein
MSYMVCKSQPSEPTINSKEEKMIIINSSAVDQEDLKPETQNSFTRHLYIKPTHSTQTMDKEAVLRCIRQRKRVQIYSIIYKQHVFIQTPHPQVSSIYNLSNFISTMNRENNQGNRRLACRRKRYSLVLYSLVQAPGSCLYSFFAKCKLSRITCQCRGLCLPPSFARCLSVIITHAWTNLALYFYLCYVLHDIWASPGFSVLQGLEKDVRASLLFRCPIGAADLQE